MIRDGIHAAEKRSESSSSSIALQSKVHLVRLSNYLVRQSNHYYILCHQHY